MNCDRHFKFKFARQRLCREGRAAAITHEDIVAMHYVSEAYLMLTFSAIGILFRNLNLLAMEPFGQIA